MRSRRLSCALALALAAIASPAFAQTDPFGQPVEPAPPPEPEPAPPPEPPPPARPVPVAPAPIAPVDAEPDVEAAPASRRPTDLSIGIGAGYELPADLQAPNRTSVRFRLPSGLTFEPIFALARAGNSVDAGGPDVESSSFGLALATDARLPMRMNDRVDLILIAGGGIAYTTTDPDGDDNDSATTIFDVHWGLGLEFWINRHWSLSFNATNPLLQYVVEVTDTGPADPEITETSSELGLVWVPEVAFMIHLYL